MLTLTKQNGRFFIWNCNKGDNQAAFFFDVKNNNKNSTVKYK